MSLPGAISITSTTQGRFYLRLGLWLACHALILFAWCERNAWPDELALPLLSLPATLLVGRQIYRQYGITLETREYESQWVLLISFLLLAVGMASGLMLLMAVGWISIGVTLLRPAQSDVPWIEWFKLPLLFLLGLPVLSDLAGSRHEWLALVVHNSGDTENFPAFFVAQVAVRIVLFTLALQLSGPAFWAGLALFPIAFFLGQQASLVFIASPYVWLIVALAIAAFALAWRALRRIPIPPERSWRGFMTGVLTRSKSPWLAALVILMQQSTLMERWLAGSQPKLEIIGVVILFAVLARLRWRTPESPLHVFSQILLASALFVLLAGEWMDLNFLRQISLGLLLVSALSWNRAWSRWVLAISLIAWASALPAAVAALRSAGVSAQTADAVRLTALAASLIALGIVVRVRPITGSQKQYNDFGWMPVKRFALILLLLLTGFQIASVHWPPGTAHGKGPAAFEPVLTSSNAVLPFRVTHVDQWAFRVLDQNVDLFIAIPPDEPVDLQSPELVLKRAGWSTERRSLWAHAHGQVAQLSLRRNGKTATALCWFHSTDQTFAHYLRARNILWSGWNLNRRDLQLVILLSESGLAPERLAQFAESNDWFINLRPRTPLPEPPHTSF